MNIFTEYDTTITIDGKDYKIIAKELDAKQQEEIETIASELKEVEALSKKAKQKREDIEANKTLSECVGLVDKAKLLWENKTLVREARELEDRIANFDLIGGVNKLFTARLAMTVGGADKEALLAVIKEKNISPQLILEKISDEIVSAKKGKSTD